MEQQLEDWMELADSEHVPPFLLLLSRSFTTAEVHSKVSIEEVRAFESCVIVLLRSHHPLDADDSA
jgi:hypothetical protein